MSQPKIGLALGGGGARGLAHIGVLKVLEEAGIPVHAIAGTSMGGLVGAYFAAGLPAAAIEADARKIAQWREAARVIDLQLSQTGAIKGKRMHRMLCQTLGEERTFANLRIPLAITAVDLNSGQAIVLQEGLVADAVRATISVPGVFRPIEHNGCRLVDGGVLNNVPADVVRTMGVDAIIAVDVLPDFSLNQPGQPPVVEPLKPRLMPLIYRQLWHVQLIMIAAMTAHRLQEVQPDVLVRPELPQDMDLFVGFGRADQAIEAGEQATRAALPQIQQLLEARH